MPLPINRFSLLATIAALACLPALAASPGTGTEDPVIPDPVAEGSEGAEYVDTPDEPTATTSLRICLIAPFTGGFGHLGARVAKAVAGPLSRIPDAEIRRFDTRGMVADAREAVRQADEAGCRLLMGGVGDREAIAVADEAEKAGIPTLLLGQARDDRHRSNVIWALTTRGDRMDLLAGHILESNLTMAFVIASSGQFGTAETRAFRKSFERVGGRVTVLPEIDEAETSWKAAAARLAAERRGRGGSGCEPAAVLVIADLSWSRGIFGYLASEGLMSAGGDCPALVPLGTSAWHDPAALARSGAALNGSVFVDLDHRGNAMGAEVFDLETEDAAVLAAAAIATVAGWDRKGVLDALKGAGPIHGRTGDLRIEADRIEGRRLVLWKVDAGGLDLLPPSLPAE
jgi:hypothetical protein